MAYCDKCGAYIPDGQTKCLACGYDEKEEAAKVSSRGGYAYESAPDKAREEEARRAEADRQAREAREKRREESRRWAEEEIKRRREERKKASEDSNSSTAYVPPKDKSSTDTSKIFAALSYLSILFVLPYIFAPNDNYAKYHAKQGLALFIASIVGDLVFGIVGFGWLMTLAKLYLIYKGMTTALAGKDEPLPFIGWITDKRQSN